MQQLTARAPSSTTRLHRPRFSSSSPSLSSAAAGWAPARGQVPSRRLACRCRALLADSSVRVRGNVRNVYNWVADYQNLTRWYPGTSNLVVTRGAGKPLNLRHQYQVDQTIAGFKLSTIYEVVDMQQDKKVVYSSASDLHVATEQLIFMADPVDPTFTVVRYMSQVELTEWRKALQPIVGGMLKQLPEQALKSLSSLLNSAQSPVLLMQQQQAANGRGGGGGGASRSGGWSFNNILNNLRNEVGGNGSNGVGRGAQAKAEPQVDVLGYYAALGLDARRARQVSADDIKSAFRRAAQTLHPDKFSMSDNEEEKVQAEESFRKVQQAYEVLRDPEQRKLYDAGKPLQMEESLS